MKLVLGQVDTTTVYGTISALSYPSPSESYQWAWENGIELLTALITCDAVSLAPVPGMKGIEEDNLGSFVEKLSFAVRKKNISRIDELYAINNTKIWARRNIHKIRNIFDELSNDENNFNRWRDWHVEYGWPEHCQRLGKLIDTKFGNYVIRVLNIDEKDFNEIIKISKTKESLKEIIVGRDSESLKLAKDIWTASVLIRGVYYDYLAKKGKERFFFHQVRENCLPKNTASAIPIYNISLSEHYLFTILLASVFKEKKTRKTHGIFC